MSDHPKVTVLNTISPKRACADWHVIQADTVGGTYVHLEITPKLGSGKAEANATLTTAEANAVLEALSLATTRARAVERREAIQAKEAQRGNDRQDP